MPIEHVIMNALLGGPLIHCWAKKCPGRGVVDHVSMAVSNVVEHIRLKIGLVGNQWVARYCCVVDHTFRVLNGCVLPHLGSLLPAVFWCLPKGAIAAKVFLKEVLKACILV